jgi:SAM-dependent methyltransferase
MRENKTVELACRFCETPLENIFVDLGMSPPCQSQISPQQLGTSEKFYPLVAYVCGECFLVQLPEYINPEEIFTEYAYFSSFSDSWLDHVKKYTEMMCERFDLDSTSSVVELASNDGYLLQYFASRGVPVLGVEPARNVADVAIEKGIPTVKKFFGKRTAKELIDDNGKADLILGNNVLAHVPDINDFVGGMKELLKQHGIITMEFPHLMRLMERNQFDTIYHEHYSYLSFLTVEKIFSFHGLRLFDVEELETHGGSIRIYACHTDDEEKSTTENVKRLKEVEVNEGFSKLETYSMFALKVMDTKRKLLEYLIQIKSQDKTIVGYGAPGKGNTLLNYCGIRTDFLDYTVDRNPYKQGNYLAGTHIPIFSPDKIMETKPDYILILPWNLKDEISAQLDYVREWGCKFIVPIPEVSEF